MRHFGFLVCLAAGCGGKIDPQQAVVLEGFGFEWDFFNHRLSHLEVVPQATETVVSLVGGTSTTNEIPMLPGECDQATCNEFPFIDTALVDLRLAFVDTDQVALVPIVVSLEVGRDGASTVATGALPKGARGEGVSFINGLRLSTDHALSGGPSCYDPGYGWHPRQLTIETGVVTVEKDTVSVPVDATFVAGKTFDPSRQCIDAVNDQAVVAFDVHLLVAVGRMDTETHAVQAEAAYAFSGVSGNPGEQPLPEPLTLAFGIDDPLIGYTAIDWRFDPERTDDRGAYLRTLAWGVSPDGEANASATNFSPGTQLEDFAFTFTGTVAALAHGGTLTRETSSAALPAALDEAGAAVVYTVAHGDERPE